MKFFVLASLVIAGYLFGTMGMDVLMLEYWQKYSHVVPAPDSEIARILPGILFLLGASLLGLSFSRREAKAKA
jgi:hypothetical protein